MALTATGTMIQEMGAAIMASPTNPHLETAALKGVLEHNMVGMVGMDTVSHVQECASSELLK